MSTILECKPIDKQNNLSNFTLDKMCNKSNISKSIDIKSHTISSTKDLIIKLGQIMQITSTDILDVTNVWYDDKYIVQSIICEMRPLSQIYIKRVLEENDSYTFMDHPIDGPIDYQYQDLSEDDFLNIVYSFYVQKGLCIKTDGTMKEIIHMITFTDDEYGKMEYKEDGITKEIKFVNMENVTRKFKEDDDVDDVQEKIKNLFENSGATHIYSKMHVGLGLLTNVTPYSALIINDKMSRLHSNEIWGDVYVGLCDNNKSTPKSIDLTRELFEKILNKRNILNQSYKNGTPDSSFCNIYKDINNA